MCVRWGREDCAAMCCGYRVFSDGGSDKVGIEVRSGYMCSVGRV